MKELLPRLGDIKLVALNFSQYSSRYDNFKKGIISPSFDPNNAGGALMDLKKLLIGIVSHGNLIFPAKFLPHFLLSRKDSVNFHLLYQSRRIQKDLIWLWWFWVRYWEESSEW